MSSTSQLPERPRSIQSSRTHRPRWACVVFPHLELDLIRLAHATQSNPLAVIDDTGCVIDANRSARQAGIRRRQSHAEALATCGRLTIVQSHALPIANAIERLCGVLLTFSDWICPEPANIGLTQSHHSSPNHALSKTRQRPEKRKHQGLSPPCHRILLEIGGSLQLFGGEQALCAQINTHLQQLGYTARIGVGVCPEQARLAIHWAQIPKIQGTMINGKTHRRRPTTAKALSPPNIDTPFNLEGLRSPECIPLVLIETLSFWTPALAQVGIHRLDQLLNLSRSELGKRYGREMIAALQRLLGEVPEHPPRWTPPEQFTMALDLPAIEYSEGLRFPLRRLLQHLETELHARNRYVDRLELRLQTEHRQTTTPTSDPCDSRAVIAVHQPRDAAPQANPSPAGQHIHTIVLQRGTPTAEAEAWWSLWRVRLERFTLPAPAKTIELRADTLLPVRHISASLLPHTTGLSSRGLQNQSATAHTPSSTQSDAAITDHTDHVNTQAAAGWTLLRARLGDHALKQLRYTGRLRPETAIVAEPWHGCPTDRAQAHGNHHKTAAPEVKHAQPSKQHAPSPADWWCKRFGRPLWRLPEPLAWTLPTEFDLRSGGHTDHEPVEAAHNTDSQPSNRVIDAQRTRFDTHDVTVASSLDAPCDEHNASSRLFSQESNIRLLKRNPVEFQPAQQPSIQRIPPHQNTDACSLQTSSHMMFLGRFEGAWWESSLKQNDDSARISAAYGNPRAAHAEQTQPPDLIASGSTPNKTRAAKTSRPGTSGHETSDLRKPPIFPTPKSHHSTANGAVPHIEQQDLRCDFYRVLDQDGRWCWVARDIRSGRWWCYGYWG